MEKLEAGKKVLFIDRDGTLVNEVPLLLSQFPDLAALVVFPRFCAAILQVQSRFVGE